MLKVTGWGLLLMALIGGSAFFWVRNSAQKKHGWAYPELAKEQIECNSPSLKRLALATCETQTNLSVKGIKQFKVSVQQHSPTSCTIEIEGFAHPINTPVCLVTLKALTVPKALVLLR